MRTHAHLEAKGVALPYRTFSRVFSFFYASLFFLVVIPVVATANPLEDTIAHGVEWLIENQEVDGSWDRGLFWSTMDAVQALENQNRVNASSKIDFALNWVQGQHSDGTDFISREVLLSQEDSAGLGFLQNADGGWGYSHYYESNLFDTVLTLSAITETVPDPILVENGVLYLKGLQGLDGAYRTDDEADYLATAIASEALGRGSFLVVNDTLLFNEEAYRSGYRSFYFLGDNRAKIVEDLHIASVLKAALYNDYSPEFRSQLVEVLLEDQNADGGWGVARGENGSAYTTATSLLALEEYQEALLGLEVSSLILTKGGDLVSPGSIKAGETYHVSTVISNPTSEAQQNLIVVGKVVKGGIIVKVLRPELITLLVPGSRTLSLEFSTDYLPEGGSLLVVEIRDSKGRVLHAREMALNVLATKRVGVSRLNVEPSFADIKSVVGFYVGLENTGNQILGNASMVVEMLLPNQTVVWSANRTTSLEVGEERFFAVGALYTAGMGYSDYLVALRVYSDGVPVEGGVAYSSLSIGPRVSVARSLNETEFPSGPSWARVNISIKGETGRPPADVVILVDSTNASGLDDVKNAMATFASSLKEGDKVAVVAVSDSVQVLQNLTNDRDLVVTAFSGINSTGPGLRLGSGINASVDLLVESGVGSNNWYIFTVVRSPSIDDPLSAVEYAAGRGVPVYLIVYIREGDG